METRKLFKALKDKFPDFEADLDGDVKTALKGIDENAAELNALAAPNKTRQDFVDFVAALGIPEGKRQALVTKLYGAYQLARLRAEDAAIATVLDSADPVSEKVKAMINKLGEYPDTTAVENFLVQDAGYLTDAIYDIADMPEDDKAAIVVAFFGRAEYNRLLASAAGNEPLVAFLNANADVIKATLGLQDSRVLSNSLIENLNNAVTSRDGMLQELRKLIPVTPESVAAQVFADNQFRSILVAAAGVNREFLRSHINNNKANVLTCLGGKGTTGEALQCYTDLAGAQEKAAIRVAMSNFGMPVLDGPVDLIFGENQYLRILADTRDTNPKLHAQLLANKNGVIAYLGMLADSNAVSQLIVAVMDGAKDKVQVAAAMQALGLDHANVDMVKEIFAENQLNRYLNNADFGAAYSGLRAQLDGRKAQVMAAFADKNDIAGVDGLVHAVQDTSKNKADLTDPMTALGLEVNDANRNTIFAENQHNRLLIEAGAGTKLHDQLTARKNLVVDQLKNQATVADVTGLRQAVINVGSNKDQIGLAMTALGLEANDANKNALFGENQHKRLLDAHAGTILQEQLNVRKAEVINTLGQKATIAEITPLVTAIQNQAGDKATIAAAMTALGLDGAQVNNLWGENQLARVIAGLLPAASELRVAFANASDPTKHALKIHLGGMADATACDAFVTSLSAANQTKDQIQQTLLAAGFNDDDERKAAAQKIYRDNQYNDMQRNWDALGHGQLKTLIETNANAFKQKIAESPAFDTPAKIKSLWNCVSTDELKAKLTAVGINATDDQLRAIVEENRVAQIPDVTRPASPELIAANPLADFTRKIGVLEQEERRIKEMLKFVQNAEFSRTELQNKEGLSRLDVSVHKLMAKMKEYVQLCNAYAGTAGAPANYNAEIAKLTAMIADLKAMRDKLTHLETLAGTPTHIKAHGDGVEAVVHPAQPNTPSYHSAYFHVQNFFKNSSVVPGGGMVKPALHVPNPVWDVGVSRSITREMDIKYQQAVTNRTIETTVKVGIIQTETKSNPTDTVSSYRQDFFFKPGDEAKMNKGKRQVSPNDKSVSIPADQAMRWANEAVKDFLAFAGVDDRMITINAGAMPKPCLEALAIVCQVNKVPFRVRGANLDISTTEMSAKADLAKQVYGSQLQTVETVTKGEYIRPRP